MNTKQLECAILSDVNMKNIVIGVFSADRLPHLPPRRPIAFIANTDPATASGRHWVAFFIDQQNVVESFDSYGKQPRELSNEFQFFVSQFEKNVINQKRLQSSLTTVCGQYCLFYLMCRCRGFSMEQIHQTFHRDLLSNDEFVYDFINDRFACSVRDCSNIGQTCFSETHCK